MNSNLKSNLQGIRSVIDDKYSEIKDIVTENQYLIKLHSSQQERFHSLHQGRDPAKPELNSLWSIEPAKYIHANKFEAEKEKTFGKTTQGCKDSDELMNLKAQDKEQTAHFRKDREEEEKDHKEQINMTQQQQKSGDKKDSEEKEGEDRSPNSKQDKRTGPQIRTAMEEEVHGSVGDDLQDSMDSLSITSEDEIEDDFEDDSKLASSIRKRISRYCSEQNQTNNNIN